MTLSASKPTNVRWGMFTLACGTSWLMYLHRYAFALFKADLGSQWNLSKTELGFLDSVQFITYGVFQFPLGIAADLAGVRLVLSILIVVWCMGLALFASAPTSQYLWVGRAVFGIGQSAAYAALSRAAKVWFPPPIRTTLAGIVGITWGRLGGLTAYLIVPPLLFGWLAMDWRTAALWLAGFGLCWGVTFFVCYRDTPRQHPWSNEAEAALIAGDAEGVAAAGSKLRFADAARQMSGRSVLNVLALNVQTTLSTLADNIFVSWIPLFLMEVHDLKVTTSGIFSALPLLGGALAGLIGGALNDWLIAVTGSRRWSRSLVGLVGKGMAAVLLLAALRWYHDPYIFCGFLFGVKLVGDWSLTSSWGVVTDIGGRATATLYSFNNAIATLGAIAASPLFGWVADQYGWRAVFVLVAITYALCAVSWLAIDTTLPVLKPTARAEGPAA
ncbi:MAG: MFS transporter [Pirellulaceae bacterium]|nr:MFS transporter [Pirellulaceae bacterium]